jgi:hypothetical protein
MGGRSLPGEGGGFRSAAAMYVDSLRDRTLLVPCGMMSEIRSSNCQLPDTGWIGVGALEDGDDNNWCTRCGYSLLYRISVSRSSSLRIPRQSCS